MFTLIQAESATIKVSLVNNNITHWKGFIDGPVRLNIFRPTHLMKEASIK